MIIQNAVKITEGKKITYLISKNRHDFNQYTFKNGETYAVDGGTSYYRRCYGKNFPKDSKIENWSLDEESFIDDIREKLLWGTTGKNGKQKLQYLPIKELTTEHLQAILNDEKDGKFDPEINPVHKKVIQYWLNKK